MNIGNLTVTINADVSGLNAAVKSFQDFEKGTVASMNRMAQKLRTVGYLTSITLTTPIVAASKASINLAKDFEFSMQKIVGLAGEAQSSVDEWRGSVLEMSRQTGRSAKELAEGLYFISSSGIKGAEALDVLSVSAKAAMAGLGETQDIAQVLTSALNAYRGTGLTAAYATDILVAGVREGKAEATGFSTALGQIIPIAANLGVSFDQVVGGMAAITLTGASAANAAVYLKGVFNALITANDQGQKVLGKTNISYETLRKILSEQGLVALMQKFVDIEKEWGSEALKDVLPNIRAITGEMSFAGKNFEYNTELMKRVTNSTGSLGVAIRAVSNTMKIQLDVALATMRASLIEIGTELAKVLIPILQDLVKWLEKVTMWFSSLTEEQKRHKVITLAIVAAAGPFLLLLSTLLYTLSGILTVVKSLGVAMTFLKGVMIGTTPLIETNITSWKRLLVVLRSYTRGVLPLLTNIISLGAKVGVPALIGVGFIKGISALSDYRDKTRDAAEANSVLYKTLVDVNGEIKKLGDLTKIDFSTMDKLQDKVNTEWKNNRQSILDRLKDAGITMEEFGEGKKAGKYEDYINMTLEKNRKLKIIYDDIQKTIDKWADGFGKANDSIEELTTSASEYNKQQAEAAARLDQEFRDIESKSFEKKWGQIFMPYTLAGKTDYGRMLKDKNKALSATLPSITVPEYKSIIPEGSLIENAAKDNEQIEMLNESLRQTKVFAAELENIFTNLFLSVGEGWDALVTSLLQSLKRLIAELLAKTAVFLILDILSGGTTRLAAGALKMVGGGYLDFMSKPLGHGLASGGIIPPGYPNDSYPAMLTSGETVVPPGKIDSLIGQKRLKIEIDGKIGGKDIMLSLRRYQWDMV